MFRLDTVKRIVIVSDNVQVNKEKVSLYTVELNKALKSEVESLEKGFNKIFDEVILYDNISEFSKNVSKHRKDIIFPYWHGENSRNRQALIPAICESENLIYVGADCYSNIVCCDKVLSKDICRINGLDFPNFELFYPGQIAFESELNFPVIVKPIYEGFSVGISQRNIVDNAVDAQFIATEISANFNQPVLVEEFIPGKEISIAIIGDGLSVKAWGAAERYHVNDDKFLDSNLIGLEEKVSRSEIKMRDACHLLNKATLDKIFNVFKWLDKVEYLRIDGKLHNEKFYCIELSNDMSLAPDGGFFKPLSYSGYDFDQSLKLLIENCLKRNKSQFPSQQ